MKITDPQVIKNGEKELLEAVQEDLDLKVVRQILKDRMEVSSLSSRGGQIIVHENKIAFRLDFDINLSGSLLFDREGNYIDESDEDATLQTKAEEEEEIELSGFELDETLDEQEPDEEDSDETDFVETDFVETDLDEASLEESDVNESDIDEINLDQEDVELENSNQQSLDEISQREISLDDSELLGTDFGKEELDEELSIVLPEYDLEDEPEITNEAELEPSSPENENLAAEEMVDDDINDILKESREFWEQKKER